MTREETGRRAAYEAEVWDLVRAVPPGRVSTYGRIASLATPPAGLEPASYRAIAPRWVGKALSRRPDDGRGRVDLGRFGWPDAD